MKEYFMRSIVFSVVIFILIFMWILSEYYLIDVSGRDNIITLVFVMLFIDLVYRLIKSQKRYKKIEKLEFAEREVQKNFKKECTDFYDFIRTHHGPRGMESKRREEWKKTKEYYSQYLSKEFMDSIEKEHPSVY